MATKATKGGGSKLGRGGTANAKASKKKGGTGKMSAKGRAVNT